MSIDNIGYEVGRPSLAALRLKAGHAFRPIDACRLAPAGRPETTTPLQIAARSYPLTQSTCFKVCRISTRSACAAITWSMSL